MKNTTCFNFKKEKSKLDRRDPAFYEKLNVLVQEKRLHEAIERNGILLGAKIQIK